MKEKTISTSTHTLTHFIEWCGDKQLESFTQDDVYDFLDYLDSYTFLRKGQKVGYSPATIRREKVIVKKFLAFVKPELGEVIKLKVLKDSKHPDDILSKDDIQKLIDACLTVRDKAMIAVFYESGGRKGEMLSVRLKHIVFDEHGAVLNIPKGKTGSRRIRLVYASSFLHQWIECHPLKGNREAFLFCSLHAPYGVISSTGISNQLHLLATRAGIPEEKVHPHNLRHSRATHLSEHLTEAQMKEYLGWTQGSNMTSVYIHLAGRDIDNAILKMHGISTEESTKDSLKVGRCPRCKEINPETSLYCGKCGLPLTDTAAIKLKSDESKIDLAFLESSSIDPAVLEILAKEVKKYIAENK